jgi:hypothetical protein
MRLKQVFVKIAAYQFLFVAGAVEKTFPRLDLLQRLCGRAHPIVTNGGQTHLLFGIIKPRN